MTESGRNSFMYTAATAATDAATCIVGMSLRIKDVINDSVRIHSLKFLIQ